MASVINVSHVYYPESDGKPTDETGALVSEQLRQKLRIEDGVVQFYHLDTGERLLSADERVAREAEARRAAEAEVARLRGELSRRRDE